MSDTYDKEVSKAAELGFKSFFADRSVNVNAALFYTDVEDMQFFNFFAGPFGLLRVVTTLDEVSIQGAEFDFRWKAGDVLSLFGGYAYHRRRDRSVRRPAVHARATRCRTRRSTPATSGQS